jgi:site-specific DNA-methyltransferase (adenine-specific)
MKNPFYNACGIPDGDNAGIKALVKELGITLGRLNYYNENNILPFDHDLKIILSHLNIDKTTFKIRMGIFDHEVRKHLSAQYNPILNNNIKENKKKENTSAKPVFSTDLGTLYQGDCLDVMKSIESNSVEMVFADPPFNLKKFYLSNIDDDLPHNDYLKWTEDWLNECIRILKVGGSLFLWNIPKWNSYFANYLNHRMTFRHWITADIKFSLPISGRLYPSHYSILYYVKGEKPNVFKPDRMPMEVCPKCYTDLKDYGGYKDKMNPLGVNLTDVWYDIPPVRHKKYKRRLEANELSIKLLDRIIELSTNENDIIFDPFGGSGTTYITAELKNRKWIGVELGPVDTIIERFGLIEEESLLLSKYRNNYNKLFPEFIKAKRNQLHLWTDDTFKKAVPNLLSKLPTSQ